MTGPTRPGAGGGAEPSVEPPDGFLAAPIDECWRRIGVMGDRTCPELETHVHCRNCPVMAAAARRFFDRAAPEGYLEGWSSILEEPGDGPEPDLASLLVFRVADEWLALPTLALVEVTTPRACHRVPHRTGGVLEGIVNVRGQLQLCISIHRLLGIESPPAGSLSSERLLVVERPASGGADRWVFRVDEVAGVLRVERGTMRAVPATVSQSGARFCEAIFDREGDVVGVLDEARFFDGILSQVRNC